MTRPRCLLLALGGNAIIPPGGAGTIEEQIAITQRTMSQVAEVLEPDARLVVTHGNGPIVGNIVLRNEAARETIPPMPLDVCGADSQGGLGYMIQQVMWNEFRRVGKPRDVTTLITRVRVDEEDPAFREPTKPIGPFYRREAADRLRALRGWQMIEDSGRGYRRVVPSPRPREIVETGAIQALLERGVVVIAAGGGGIPVVRRADGSLAGIEAVVDKDRTAAVLARAVGADRLVIVTGVDRVAIGFGSRHQHDLALLGVDEARRYLAAGEFPAGSMGPKIEAAVEFVAGGGREAIITSPAALGPALRGAHGTRIVPAGASAAAPASTQT
jgi:carbamate kinase